MPSDAKKKRDLQKKNAAKQRQAQLTKKPNATNSASGTNNPNDEDLIEDNNDDDEEEIQNGSETPNGETNGASNDLDPNVKSLIQNLDLLTMVEKANTEARSCTGRSQIKF